MIRSVAPIIQLAIPQAILMTTSHSGFAAEPLRKTPRFRQRLWRKDNFFCFNQELILEHHTECNLLPDLDSYQQR